MARFVVGPAADIPPGSRKRILVDGRPILVLNVKGEYFALSDTCPHKGASLSQGVLTGLVKSGDEPGRYTYERAGEIIRCPWHQWEFDIRTGRSQCDPRRMRLLQFETAVEQGAALVEGPLRAETFPIHVEEDYLLIEIG